MTSPLDPTRQAWLRASMAKLRDKLIDLSKRNPLVSFRHSERGASFLRVIDERPDLLFARLQDGHMGFEPLPAANEAPRDEQTPQFRITWEKAKLTDPAFLLEMEGLGTSESDEAKVEAAERALRARVRAELGLPKLEDGRSLDIAALARAHGFDPSFELAVVDGDEGAATHHGDRNLRVLLTADRLEARLRTIHDRYRGHAAETGLHTLFLAFGFVEWFEDEASKLPLHAPALVLPVHLERRLERSRHVFTLTARDEDLAVNVAMKELLRQKFKLEAPQLRADETPESYFIRLAEVLAEEPRLRLTLRRFVTIAVLPFPRMVLWQDLDPAVWPGDALDAHPLLPRLLGAQDAEGGGGFMPDYPIDAPDMAPRVPPLVKDADVSQHSALIDVSEGKSLAIEGPPGTGKSQTITNIIAAALDRGRRVLFVAEKQAALDVVAKRLADVGLGPLLLQLHSDRATKTEVLKALGDRLAARAPADTAELDALRAELAEKKALLRRYLALLAEPLGQSGRTTHKLVWRELALRTACAAYPPPLHALPVADAAAIDGLQLKRARDALDNVAAKAGEIAARYGSIDGSPWSAARRLGAFNQDAELAAARAAAAAGAAMMERIAAAEAATGLDLAADPLGQAAAMAALPDPAGVAPPLLRAALNDAEGAAALLARSRKWQATRAAAEAVHARPLTPGEEEVAALDALIGPAAAVPASPAAARLDLAAAEARLAALERLEAGLKPLLDRLGLDGATPFGQIRAMASAIERMAAAPEAVAAIRSERLLDDDARGRLRAGRAEADRLAAEGASLGETMRIEEALGADPARLEALAGEIESASWAARLFGGGYKASWREAARLFVGEPERASVPEALRRLKRLVEARAAFRDVSPARSLFGEAAWHGVESDWDTLAEAESLLAGLIDECALAGCEAAAERIAVEPMRSVRRLAQAGAAVAGDLAGLADVLATETIASARQGAETRRAELVALIGAAEAAGLRPDAPLRQGDASAAALIRRAQAAHRALDSRPEGPLWAWFAGAGTDLAPFQAAVDYGVRLQAGASAEVLHRLAAAEDPSDLAARMRARGAAIGEAAAEWRSAGAALAAQVGAEADAFLRGPTAAAHARLIQAAEDEAGLRLHADLGKYLAEAEAQGCRFVYDAARDAGAPVDRLADLYELLVVRALLQQFLQGGGAELERLGGLGLAQARTRFAEIDNRLQGVEARRILAERLASDRAPEGVNSGPRGSWTELALIRHEIGKKTKHVPIRDLLSRAGTAVAALKPVWMMSPTSAAQYIQPGSNQFDIVVIDEASQMRPEYAVSSVARGAQLVVVGDSNQLPPTDFFTMAQAGGDEEGEEDYSIDTESILDLANQRLPHKRRLSWHYRSEHESLIQFSNRRFYGRGLVVFPSPTTDDPLLGVKHVYVGGTYEAQINQQEAQAVIEAATGIMLSRPELSMGIATMNLKQRDLIWAEFERIQAQDRAVQSYVERHAGTIEPFFVKNLENVQGDERDVILISTVYGPDRNGHVFQRFGPLNSKVGHRRLNVLVTRAKQTTRVFTSLRPDEIKAAEKTNEGVLATQDYLRYAAGGAVADDAGGGEPDSDFEVFVAERLRAAGYQVVHQVGVEGFRIDLGIKHPSFPLGFVAGVECDGASYHSGLSIRDRDKIRQAVLEKLGWNIYRIWSTDWFADPAAETARLVTALDGWRAAAAAAYDARRQSGEFEAGADEETAANEAAAAPVAPEAPPPPAQRDPATGPTGKHHQIDDVDFYETMRGAFFEVWPDGVHGGDVEVLSRAALAPRLYAGAAAVQRSQYRGTVRATGETFLSDDLYVAVRRIARAERAARVS